MDWSHCTLCPRNCGVSRQQEGKGFCTSGNKIRIARADLHFWEEPVISGEKGSGAVFFTGCPLRCRFCQNYEISAGDNRGIELTPEQLSQVFFSLVEKGAHNINLVTATHFLPLVRQALLVKKLPVPVVYNTSGYEKPEAIATLEGLVDIYLPDYKYCEPSLAAALSHAEDYPLQAEEAIEEMVRQVGAPVVENGLMKKGVLIRHLVLPGHTKNSIGVLERIKEKFPGIPVSLMAQYTPCREIPDMPEMNRRITQRELEKVENAMFSLDLDGFVQDRSSGKTDYIPDFHQFEEEMYHGSDSGII